MNKTFNIATLIAAASALQLKAVDESCKAEHVEWYEDMAPLAPNDDDLLMLA